MIKMGNFTSFLPPGSDYFQWQRLNVRLGELLDIRDSLAETSDFDVNKPRNAAQLHVADFVNEVNRLQTLYQNTDRYSEGHVFVQWEFAEAALDRIRADMMSPIALAAEPLIWHDDISSPKQ